MKTEKGVTLTSLIIYIVAMLITVATIATMTKYFYGNLDNLTDRNKVSKNYTSFNSYFTTDVNEQGNEVLYSEESMLVFTNGNQYTFKDNGIYMNKINICNNVNSCTFEVDNTEKTKITVKINIDGKDYSNVYTLKGE